MTGPAIPVGLQISQVKAFADYWLVFDIARGPCGCRILMKKVIKKQTIVKIMLIIPASG